MIEGLRAEFPGVARSIERLRPPTLGKEPFVWAFVSAVGGAFLTSALLGLVVGGLLFPALFPPTREHPAWLDPGAIARLGALFVAGTVAFRAGGPATLLAYVVYELLLFAAGIPGRLTFCERSGGPIPPLSFDAVSPCDQLAVFAAQWPRAVALVVGALLSVRLLGAGPRRSNTMLRGAGIFALAASTLGIPVGYALGGSGQDLIASSLLVLVVQVVAGALAGAVLAPGSFARALVVALLIILPLGYAVPLAVSQAQQPIAFEMLFTQVASIAAPLLGAIALLAARAYVRRRRGLSLV